MKEIKEILLGKEENLRKKQLVEVLIPFAMIAAGIRPAVYNGTIPESLQIAREDGEYILMVEENPVCKINPKTNMASVYGSDDFPLTTEDIMVIEDMVNTIKSRSEEQQGLPLGMLAALMKLGKGNA